MGRKTFRGPMSYVGQNSKARPYVTQGGKKFHGLCLHVRIEQDISSPFLWASTFISSPHERALNISQWAAKLPLAQNQFSCSELSITKSKNIMGGKGI